MHGNPLIGRTALRPVESEAEARATVGGRRGWGTTTGSLYPTATTAYTRSWTGRTPFPLSTAEPADSGGEPDACEDRVTERSHSAGSPVDRSRVRGGAHPGHGPPG